VSAEVTITDSQNDVVCSETQSVTSNDFGILSFIVGNADTFKEVAIGRLPLFISVSVDGVLIGKSQILNVPVAEVANTLKSDFTLDELCGKKWNVGDRASLIFGKDGACTIDNGYTSWKMNYTVEGNMIYLYSRLEDKGSVYHSLYIYTLKNGVLYGTYAY